MKDEPKTSVAMDASDTRFAVVRVMGRLDAGGVASVEPALTAASAAHARLALDLAGVPYLASVALRLLLATARSLEKRGGRLVVVNPAAEIEGVLAIAGLEKPLRVCVTKTLPAAFGL